MLHGRAWTDVHHRMFAQPPEERYCLRNAGRLQLGVLGMIVDVDRLLPTERRRHRIPRVIVQGHLPYRHVALQQRRS
jgi:hypothetical protein